MRCLPSRRRLPDAGRVACSFDALLVGLIGLPINIAWMMLVDQHLPLITRQMPDCLRRAPVASSVISVRVLP